MFLKNIVYFSSAIRYQVFIHVLSRNISKLVPSFSCHVYQTTSQLWFVESKPDRYHILPDHRKQWSFTIYAASRVTLTSVVCTPPWVLEQNIKVDKPPCCASVPAVRPRSRGLILLWLGRTHSQRLRRVSIRKYVSEVEKMTHTYCSVWLWYDGFLS